MNCLNKNNNIRTEDAIDQTTPDQKSHPIFFIGVGIFVSIGLWLLWGKEVVWWWASYWHNRLAFENPTEMTLAELGQAGDLFGGINALFASFAFMGVIFAAYYQRKTFLQQIADSKASETAFEKSLAQQKIDTATNKKALDASMQASNTQIKAAQKELFNSFFFRMLAEVDSTMKSIELTSVSVFGKWFEESKISADSIMEQIEMDLHSTWHQIFYANKKAELDKNQHSQDPIYFVDEYHRKIYKPNINALAPFLRNFFHTFIMIKESDMSYSEQCKYSKIARASISEQILVLIMLNGLSKEGKNLKPIIERYGLLKHLGADGNTTHARKIAGWFYHPTAFQGYGDRYDYYTKLEQDIVFI